MVDCSNSGPPNYLSFFTTAVSLCLALVTIPGNLFVCYAIIRDPFKELQTPFNFLILSLALTDLLVGVLMDPVSVIFHLTEGLPGERRVDIRMLHILYFILSTASILTLAALTLDRYMAVVHPLKYKNTLTARRSIVVSVLIWVLSLMISGVYFKLGYFFYSLIFTNTAVVVTFVVLLFVYVSIYKRLNQQSKSLSQRKNLNAQRTKETKKELYTTRCQTRVTKALVLVLLAYIICFIPVCIIIYILNFCTICSCEFIEWLRDLQFVIVLLNSAVNPYLYAWRMPQYKKILRKFAPRFLRQVDSDVQTSLEKNNDGNSSRAARINKDDNDEGEAANTLSDAV